ncbi:MAG: presqualene diphosphate synthase HpnD, partial [Caulobacteraceae bacterium]
SDGTTASGSSFYAAMRILPRAQREAMFQIYSFCRQVDDIADSDGPRPERLEALQQWRDDIDALYRGDPPPRLADYAASVGRFGLKREDFLAIVDGMEMDVPQDIRGPDLATLDLYCDRVASAVGRLSVRVFGLGEDDGILLAHHLGRALQFTNILRDFDEDAAIGRLYLAREMLDEAGISGDDPTTVVNHPNIDQVGRAFCRLAKDHYAAADEVMAAKPKGKLIAPRLMSAVYSRTLSRTADKGWAAPRERVSLRKPELIWALVRHGIFG